MTFWRRRCLCWSPLWCSGLSGPGRLGDGSSLSAYSCHWRALPPTCCWDRNLTTRRCGPLGWALSPVSPVLTPVPWHEKAWTNCFGHTKGCDFPTKVPLNQKVTPRFTVLKCMLRAWEYRFRCWPAGAGETPHLSKAPAHAFLWTPVSLAAKLSSD